MRAFLKEPEVRLFFSALLVGGVAFANKFIDVSGHVSWSSAALHGAIVAGALAFAHTFTPLNQATGIFKDFSDGAPTDPPAVIEPPETGVAGTEAPVKGK